MIYFCLFPNFAQNIEIVRQLKHSTDNKINKNILLQKKDILLSIQASQKKFNKNN